MQRLTPHSVNSVAELHSIFSYYKESAIIYRGVSDLDKHDLTPSVGRYKSVPPHKRKDFELSLFQVYKLKAISFCETSVMSEWDWIAVAQHHGLPTRLLDWTTNPLVAAYFAVEKDYETDGAIYLLELDASAEINQKLTPFEIQSLMKFEPPHIDRRFSAQAGVFTVHPDPFSPLDKNLVNKLVIPSSTKKEILAHLDHYQVNRATLFPGLDGIADHLKMKNSEFA